ncbi:MAG: cation-translocating P-type ATPase [Oscillospiraceae bacterium]|nr:cation-translocating P-type ATPase [Oscillospiraceae bacterium]
MNSVNYFKGLTTKQAEEILEKDGANVLAESEKSKLIAVFFGQFKDVMVLILLAATGFSLIMGEIWDAVTIIIIVVFNASLGFFQEYRTEKTLEALKKIAAPAAKVFRDGKLVSLPADRLVKGDIIKLEAGAKIPADCRILTQTALECDESMLTGESVGVSKNTSSALCYMGTAVTRGHAVAEITSTGAATEMGRISGLLSDIEPEKTPLQKRLSELGRLMGISCLAVCFFVSLVGVLRGFAPFDMVFTGISLAVAAIPEGLPATVTISLALAARRIYKQKALINKLHAVETLGCTNVICTDKTGTLTQNKMTVVEVWGENERLLYLCGVLCNNAVRQPDGSFVGDPTETALMESAAKAGVFSDNHVRSAETPFDNAARFMTVTARDSSGISQEYLKGAPDAVLGMCGFIMKGGKALPLTEKNKKEIYTVVENMTAKALRLLGFAYRRDGEQGKSFVFLGLQGLLDPLRPEVKGAVKKCKTAGIKVVMLTGDHKNTAVQIASQAGITAGGQTAKVYTGSEISVMSDLRLREVVKTARVFARVSPSDKLRIVRAFKFDGSVVAMTGDGVNDAPAVKEASIGAAMGITGTDVTKEAAQIVLLDDNFATLVSAVEQGRTIYNNIRKFVRYMLSCNLGEIITMLFALLLGMPVVLLPIQILLINLVTDGLPAIALGMEPPDPDIMKKPPRKSNESIFAGRMITKIFLRGLGIGFFTLLTFYIILKGGVPDNGFSLSAARTAALATLGLSQLVFVFECKDSEKGLFNARFGNNPKLIVAVLISFSIILCVMISVLLSPIFKTVPLDINQIGLVFALSMGYPILKGVLKSRF